MAGGISRPPAADGVPEIGQGNERKGDANGRAGDALRGPLAVHFRTGTEDPFYGREMGEVASASTRYCNSALGVDCNAVRRFKEHNVACRLGVA